MGFFDKLFNRNTIEENERIIPWSELTSEDAVEITAEESHEKLVVIFKHSTRCGISRMVLRQFERSFDFDTEQVKLYYVDLLQNRNVSNKVAEKFGVFHESPQYLIIKNGCVVHHASHHTISAEKIAEFL